jgi:hypothetical protein
MTGDTMAIREQVKKTDDVKNHVLQKEPGKTTEGEAVRASTETLLDGTDGTLDFTDMAVMWDEVEVDRQKVGCHTGEFGVSMDITDAKTPCRVQGNNGTEFGEDDGGMSGADGRHGAKAEATGDEVYKR